MTVCIDSTENNSLLIVFCLIYSWVDHLPVPERLLSIWNDIKKLIKFWERLPKSKQPSCKSCNHLTNAVSDILMPAKVQVFCFISGIMQPFLTKYRSDKPKRPYLYSDIQKLINELMQLIVKPDQLERCESYLDFRRIDLDEKESITKPKDMNIGFAARSSIHELRKNDEIRNSVPSFSSESTKLIVTILKNYLKKVLLVSMLLKTHPYSIHILQEMRKWQLCRGD